LEGSKVDAHSNWRTKAREGKKNMEILSAHHESTEEGTASEVSVDWNKSKHRFIVFRRRSDLFIPHLVW